ncbi:restriction endonuclease subunit S [Dyadobacter sp. CY347]|uniref:restriction endonuclease subunit S n=1 Tax=Dyadobacter sp. CY347 TaxID=2909336 RepID=UPI001F1EDA8B|nr:restriction endonuclease subunit S [Dyadobacter sp. CY347]MCF2491130.1 restriction endonuclease subunit S [Dyadobacter sp. CY347]
MSLDIKKPKIRFKEFSGTWEHKELNMLLREAKQRNTHLKFGKKDVLSVSGEFGIVNQIEHLGRSYAGESVHNYHVVENGDIVYTKSPLRANPYGIIKVNKGVSGIVSTLYAVYKVINEQASGAYLDHYFSLDENTNAYLRPLVKKGAKNDMKVNNLQVLSDRIWIPSVPEQEKVSLFLSKINQKISWLKKERDLLTDYKNGMMHRIFSNEIRFKDDDGKEFAKWDRKKLGDLFSLVSRPVAKPTDNYKALGVRSHFKGTFQRLDSDPSKIEMDILYQVKKNDLIVNITFAWEGAVAIATEDDEGGLVSHRFPTYLCNNEILLLDFFRYLYPNNLFKNALELISPGGAGRNRVLKKDDFLKIEFNMPSMDEQRKISNFLSIIDNKIKHTEAKIGKMETWKRGLLQQMFV